MWGFRRHPPAGQQLASELGMRVTGDRAVALSCWPSGPGRRELKDVLGSCLPRTCHPTLKAASSPRQKIQRE